MVNGLHLYCAFQPPTCFPKVLHNGLSFTHAPNTSGWLPPCKLPSAALGANSGEAYFPQGHTEVEWELNRQPLSQSTISRGKNLTFHPPSVSFDQQFSPRPLCPPLVLSDSVHSPTCAHQCKNIKIK